MKLEEGEGGGAVFSCVFNRSSQSFISYKKIQSNSLI